MFEIVVGVILVVIGWMEFAYAKLMRFKREARTNWIKVDAMLKARSRTALNLLEALRERDILEPEMGEIFELDGGYRETEDRDIKAELSEKVTPHLYSLLNKLKVSGLVLPEIEEILENDAELEKMAEKYNESIRAHNAIIDLKKYKYQIMLLRPNRLRDFELKRELES